LDSSNNKKQKRWSPRITTNKNPLWRETNLSPFANPQQLAGKLGHYVPNSALVREKAK
jgi:hypothetical protein